MSNDYTVNKVYLKELDFEILIVVLPESDIKDKLTVFTSERGRITEMLYADFVIANFIANVNQFLSRATTVSLEVKNELDLYELRDKVIKAIIEANPILDPDNLVLNRNYVLKVKGEELVEEETPLKENKYWKDTPEQEISDVNAVDIEEVVKIDEELKEENKILDIEKLKYVEEDIWWKRIGKYIKIKRFDDKAKNVILTKKAFHSSVAFESYIVATCIIDFEVLYNALDSMGITANLSSPVLIHELFSLCLEVNPFLTYKNSLELLGEDADNEPNPRKAPNRKMATASGTANAYSNKKPKRSFKTIPKKELVSLGDSMKKSLKGQDEAVDKLMEAILRASIGLKDPVKPIGSFLFAGRTGVGKTLATKILADELIKGKDNLITIDCSEYTADHEYSKLIGAPSGYLGHENGGILTNAIAKNPFSVVVFDEVEKASHKVHQLLLQILEEGRLTDGKGKTVSFNEAIIILTSNVGVKEVDAVKKTIGFGDVAVMTDKKKDQAINEALKDKFKPEFLNRLDSIIFFKNLTDEDYMDIIDLELAKLVYYLKENESEYADIELKFNKSLKDFVFENGINEEYGARPIKRCIEKEVSTALARKLLEDEVDGSSIVSISMKKGKANFTIKTKKKTKEVKKIKVKKKRAIEKT